MLVERNADFINRPTDRYPRIEQEGKRVSELDLDAFSSEIAMTFWERAAYFTYGDSRCRMEGIEALQDLFGPNFSRLFFLKKNALHAQESLPDAEEALRLTTLRFESLMAEVSAWSEARDEAANIL